MLLVALLLSLLLHQVLLTLFGVFWEPPAPQEEKLSEVMLLKEPEPKPEPKQPAVKPLPEPKVQPQKNKPRKIPKPVEPPAPTPEPTQTAMTEPPPPMAGPPEMIPTPPSNPVPPNLNLNLNWSSFERVFSQEAELARRTYSERSLTQRRQAGSFKSQFSDRVRSALASNHGWVQPGNQEPLGNRKQLFHHYLEMVHTDIHTLFADSFLSSLSNFAPDDPLNDFSLHAVVEFEILNTGHLNEVRVVKSSGNTVFDAAAVDSLYRSSPYPSPPPKIRSWNDRVYMRWGFYRNHRKCGLFNAEPFILRTPGGAPEPISPDQFIIEDG